MTDSPDHDSAAGFFHERGDWMAVEAIPRPGGGYDIALVIDGTYSRHEPDLVQFYADWISTILEREGPEFGLVPQSTSWGRKFGVLPKPPARWRRPK